MLPPMLMPFICRWQWCFSGRSSERAKRGNIHHFYLILASVQIEKKARQAIKTASCTITWNSQVTIQDDVQPGMPQLANQSEAGFCCLMDKTSLWSCGLGWTEAPLGLVNRLNSGKVGGFSARLLPLVKLRAAMVGCWPRTQKGSLGPLTALRDQAGPLASGSGVCGLLTRAVASAQPQPAAPIIFWADEDARAAD